MARQRDVSGLSVDHSAGQKSDKPTYQTSPTSLGRVKMSHNGKYFEY